MTYQEALKIKPGDKVQMYQYYPSITVLETRIENKTVRIKCDDGLTYYHKDLKLPPANTI